MASIEVNSGNNFTRDQFGPGKAGEEAFRIINSSETCEYKSQGEQCEAQPNLVLGFDIMGELEQIPLCAEHEYPFREKVEKQLMESRNHAASFSINGFGRS